MLFPHTDSRHVTLRPAAASDATKVYDILFKLGSAALPMIDTYVEQFGRGKSACFLVHRRDADGGEELVGFSALGDLAPAGHLRAEVHLLPGLDEDVVTEAHTLTTNFAFAMWRTRKVYFHTTESSPSVIGFGGERSVLVRAEAVLPSHAFFHGRLWDVHVFAVYREDWDILGADLLKQIV
ncbi:GNAT family N-acetyltransferase [Dactylosporangium sp. NBC_01737]|uniref:GNAT family N-acetyltransferase n=1 Tax=Dactylosporangium sp. NBC_01737 TaxID=2975959 RepID=UPI002E120D89|nr:GNAT family N-acetyltransferase [Dactylosporangium sp. NBC_01737]